MISVKDKKNVHAPLCTYSLNEG